MSLIDPPSKEHSMEPMSSRYLPEDLEKIQQCAAWLHIKPRAVPRVAVRALYELCKLALTFRLLGTVIFHIYKYYVLDVAQKKESVLQEDEK